ncbi:MAG TPA: sulfocyanin-like copper-binding protein [Gemmatimonadota bacterium]|nr:sulfocyanin-like copper-binding protein [Gemmatimonadota bacterium]
MRISASLTTLLLTLGLLACGGAADEGEDTTAMDTTAMAEEPAADMAGPEGSLSTPAWMTMDETARTVSMDIRAGDTEANNRWNFNGLYAGEGAIVVPQGYSVTINFTNADPNQPHSLGIDEAMDSYPAVFESPEPVFAGAITPDAATTGTAPNGSATISFTADTAGEYAMVCYIAGHAVAGMVLPFEVSADGSAGVRE